jgi:hypothetical protein
MLFSVFCSATIVNMMLILATHRDQGNEELESKPNNQRKLEILKLILDF